MTDANGFRRGVKRFVGPFVAHCWLGLHAQVDSNKPTDCDSVCTMLGRLQTAPLSAHLFLGSVRHRKEPARHALKRAESRKGARTSPQPSGPIGVVPCTFQTLVSEC